MGQVACRSAVALAIGWIATTGCSPAPPPPSRAETQAVPVAMYMTEWCPVCRQARSWLDERGYNFVEHDIERDPRAAVYFVAVNPRGSVPTFEIDGRILIGFDPDQLSAAISEAAAEPTLARAR